MSEACSQGSAGSTSGLNEPDTGSCSSANPTSGDDRCCGSGSPEFRAYMPFRTLMPDGTVEEGFAERDVIDALHQPTGNKEPLILSAAASHAKTSPSPADEPDSCTKEDAPTCSSSSHGSQMSLYGPEGMSSLRTFPDSFPPTTEGISPSFSRRWPSSGFTTSPGECWTADTSESPNDAAGFSSLADVLEDNVARKYFLSPRAAAGILRRAEKRGRMLPSHLSAALEAVARTTTTPKQGRIVGTMTARDNRAVGADLAAAGMLVADTPAFALRKDPGGTGQGHNTNYVTAEAAVRRLTPVECERLQGFPDHWTRLDDKTPDSRRYAALGDAVTVNVAHWIGRRLAAHVATEIAA